MLICFYFLKKVYRSVCTCTNLKKSAKFHFISHLSHLHMLSFTRLSKNISEIRKTCFDFASSFVFMIFYVIPNSVQRFFFVVLVVVRSLCNGNGRGSFERNLTWPPRSVKLRILIFYLLMLH